MYYYISRYRSLRDYRLGGYVNNLFSRVLMTWLEQNGYCPTHARLSAVDRIKSILKNKSKIKAQLQFDAAINEVLTANAKNNYELKEMQDELECELNKLVEETFFTDEKSTSCSGVAAAALTIGIISLVLASIALTFITFSLI